MSDAKLHSRQFSLCTVMEHITHCGPISRASIARQTGLSKQTISEIVLLLERDGWIHRTGRTSGHVGRSAITYEIVPDAACIATVDLGGTKVRAAIADLSCRVPAALTEPTDERGGMAVVRQIARMCREAAKQNAIPFGRVRLAVVGVPGVPEETTGRVLMAPNIRGLASHDIAASLEAELGFDVIIENDVNLAVIGESWIGAGAGFDDLAYVALGTGIGAGIMVGGELVRGHHGAAGELGFLPFGADPFEPESLRVGALERVTATVGMRTRYRAQTGQDVDVPTIFDLSTKGDPAARAVLDETAQLVARAVAAISALTNPERVVLGGSIGGRDEMLNRVRTFASRCSSRPVEVVASRLGIQSTLVGGAAVGLGHLHTILFSGGVPGAEISLPPADVVRLADARQ